MRRFSQGLAAFSVSFTPNRPLAYACLALSMSLVGSYVALSKPLAAAIPVFVLAYLLIWLVSLKLGWLPVQGYQRIAEGFGPFIRHLILPSVTLSVIYIALIARVTRASDPRRGHAPPGRVSR